MDRIEYALKNLNGKILDVGFSVGELHTKLVNAFGKNVYGIDIEVKKNSKNYKKASAEKKIPFKSNYFDSIFAGELIEHLHKPKNFVKEANRVLKKNGVIIITTPNRDSLINRIFHNYHAPLHFSLFNFQELKSLLEENGFKVVDYYCQPYTEENSYGSKNKWSFAFRKILHYFLPKSLQEEMIVKSIKVE
ncbi:MAG: class I SAM-dependent methyltransferase [Candidatus Diapherotrites archaeon]